MTGFEWFSIAWAAVVSVMIGYSLWGWAIARAGAGRSVHLSFPSYQSSPSLFDGDFPDERLGATQVIGGAVALTQAWPLRGGVRCARANPIELDVAQGNIERGSRSGAGPGEAIAGR
ncbi:MAG: hypothetical protein R2855_10060 [Thermomicrobiales bacterium]